MQQQILKLIEGNSHTHSEENTYAYIESIYLIRYDRSFSLSTLRKLLAYGNYKVFTEKECSEGSGERGGMRNLKPSGNRLYNVETANYYCY